MDQLLATTEPFKRLAPGERRYLAQAACERRYAKGETVFRAGEPSDAICVVKRAVCI